MPELPSHQDTGSAASPAPIARVSRRRRVLVAVVVAVVVLAAVLHLTGVLGGESH
jgi:hypothetical protein